MKKVLAMLLMLVGVLAVPNVSLAANWVMINRTMEFEDSIDLDSVKVIRYNPPFYVLEAMSRNINYSRESSYVLWRYFYNYDNKDIKGQLIAGNYGEGWIYYSEVGLLDPPKSLSYGSAGEEAANLAFRKAYNMRFR